MSHYVLKLTCLISFLTYVLCFTLFRDICHNVVYNLQVPPHSATISITFLLLALSFALRNVSSSCIVHLVMSQSGSESHELKSKRTSLGTPMTLDDEDPDTLNEFDRRDYEVAIEALFYRATVRAARRKAIECYPESFSRTSSSGRHPGGDNDSDVSQSAPPSKRVKRECRNPYCEVLHHLLEWRLSDVIDAQVYYVPEVRFVNVSVYNCLTCNSL